MIAMMLGSLGLGGKNTYWAPISEGDNFPSSISKELYRLDDGTGSGSVLIETSVATYHGVKLLAHVNGGHMQDFSYNWPKGANFLVKGSVFLDYYLPIAQKNCRDGYITFPVIIPKDRWGKGIPAESSEFICYMNIQLLSWSFSSGFDPRYWAILVGDAPTSGRNRILRIVVNMSDDHFPSKTPLDEVWSIVSNKDYLIGKLFDGELYEYSTYDPGLTNAKAEYTAKSYLIDTSTSSSSILSPNRGEYSFWFGRATRVINNSEFINAAGFSKAFYKAQDGLPEASQNQIANICDVVSSIRNFAKKPYLVVEHGSSALKNAWLAYRYSYSTTKSDILELSQLSERLLNLGDVVKSYGSFSDGNIRYYAEIIADASYYMPDECNSLLRRLQQYGTKLNAQNMWDMIPYSFVADWFLDVSGLLASFDNWIAASSIPIKEVWYSCVSSYDDGRAAYFRWCGEPPALPSWSYHVSTSGGTWLKRLADAISLF